MKDYIIAGLAVVLIIAILSKMLNRNNKRWTVMRFFRPSCGACQSSQSEWDMFKYKHNLKGVFVTDINMEQLNPQSQSMAEKYNINGVPTVVAVDQAGNYRIYEGMRTYDSYRRWAELL